LVLTKSAIQDLSAIAQLPNLKEIECDQCDEITDASALGVLTQLEKVTFSQNAKILKPCHRLEIRRQGIEPLRIALPSNH